MQDVGAVKHSFQLRPTQHAFSEDKDSVRHTQQREELLLLNFLTQQCCFLPVAEGRIELAFCKGVSSLRNKTFLVLPCFPLLYPPLNA